MFSFKMLNTFRFIFLPFPASVPVRQKKMVYVMQEPCFGVKKLWS